MFWARTQKCVKIKSWQKSFALGLGLTAVISCSRGGGAVSYTHLTLPTIWSV